jgi:cytochrome c oxidase subunit IV
MQNLPLKRALRRGYLVFIPLIVLTVSEYVLPLVMDHGALPWLVIMAMMEAALIVYYFMHIAQLWRREE